MHGITEYQNMKTKSEWNLEKGYVTSATLETEPRRATEAGANAGISIILHHDAEFSRVEQFVCCGLYSYKV